MFNNTMTMNNLVDMQRTVAITVIDRALARVNTDDVSERFDNDHGNGGWDELLDHRNRLAEQNARHQT